MRVLLLSAYHTASHRSWCEGLISHLNNYQWTLLTLEDRYFRYRIRANPLSWSQAPELQASYNLEVRYDLIVATSMVDLATLKGLFPHLAAIPSVVYFHENQFAFPVSSQQHSSVDPQMVTLYSALAADQIVFNSQWNRSSFLEGVSDLLARFPDHVPQGVTAQLMSKSEVLPVPISEKLSIKSGNTSTSPVRLVWAARWEYDKGPDRLLLALRELESRNIDYRISIVGQSFRKIPQAFTDIQAEFAHRIDVYGYQADRDSYIQVMQGSDFFISTAIHEFQGLSAMEAVACGCVPILPKRLSYPELFGDRYCYGGESGGSLEAEAVALVDLLIEKANNLALEQKDLMDMKPLTWPVLVLDYQRCFESVLDGRRLSRP